MRTKRLSRYTELIKIKNLFAIVLNFGLLLFSMISIFFDIQVFSSDVVKKKGNVTGEKSLA